MVVDLLLLILTLIAGFGTIYSRSLLRAAISLGVTSIFLSLLMFRLGSPMAAVFELSVCAGLITVIFASAISLMKVPVSSEIIAAGKERIKRYLWLPILLLVVGGLLVAIGLPGVVPRLPEPPVQGVGRVLWTLRQPDLLGQIIILLTGAFGVVVFFKERHHG